MSAAADYRAAIEHVLRDEYRVDGLRFARGAGHPCVRFEYAGRRFRLTLHGAEQRAQSGNLLALKLQDIRRLLGVPLPRPPQNARRTLA